MKKLTTLLFMSLIAFGCQNEPQKNVITQSITSVKDTIEPESEKVPAEFDLEKHLINYQQLKSKIASYQATVKRNNKVNQAAKMEIAADYMSEILIDSIFSYWIGTTWDFNGISEKPRDGEIACGYFVSTTIRDAGIKLNRYKIAQKGAADIIKALCAAKSIKTLSSLEKLEAHLKTVGEMELLIVGLDYHVGFIFKKEDKSYFAHSNYIGRKGVEIERLRASDALKNSNLYVIGSFSKNKMMIQNWLR